MPPVARINEGFWIPEWIPSVSEKELVRTLDKQVKPMVRIKKADNGRLIPTWDGTGTLYFTKPRRLFRNTFLWRLKIKSEAVDVVHLCDIKTYHVCDYTLLFKPTLDEVFIQIPEKYREEVIGFEMILDSSKAIISPDPQSETSATSYHVVTTKLYGRQ